MVNGLWGLVMGLFGEFQSAVILAVGMVSMAPQMIPMVQFVGVQ